MKPTRGRNVWRCHRLRLPNLGEKREEFVLRFGDLREDDCFQRRPAASTAFSIQRPEEWPGTAPIAPTPPGPAGGRSRPNPASCGLPASCNAVWWTGVFDPAGGGPGTTHPFPQTGRRKRADATVRSWAGHDGPVLRDPSRDAATHIVDAPVSRLPVQHAGDPEAALSAMTVQGDGLSGAGNGGNRTQPRADIAVSVRIEEGQQMTAFDVAGLAPFLRRPFVDDRHVVCQQALEAGAVDMDNVGAKPRSATPDCWIRGAPAADRQTILDSGRGRI